MNKHEAFERLNSIASVLDADRTELADQIRKCATALRPKSRQFESYYWAHIVPMVADFLGETPACAHRFLLSECAQRDKNGNPIGTSDEDFHVKDQLAYVDAVRMMMARDMGLKTDDPDPKWRDRVGNEI